MFTAHVLIGGTRPYANKYFDAKKSAASSISSSRSGSLVLYRPDRPVREVRLLFARIDPGRIAEETERLGEQGKGRWRRRGDCGGSCGQD